MSELLTPGERTTLWGKIGDLARRVARLEAVPAPTASGITEVTSVDSSVVVSDPTGPVVDLSIGTGYIRWNSLNDEIAFRYLIVYATDIAPGGGNYGQKILADADILIESLDGHLFVKSAGNITFQVGNGGNFTVLDFDGNPILQMTDGSPDLHIQTGGLLVPDL